MSARDKKPRPLTWDLLFEASDRDLGTTPRMLAQRITNLRHRGEHEVADQLQHELTFWEAHARLCPGAPVSSYDATEVVLAELHGRGLRGAPFKPFTQR